MSRPFIMFFTERTGSSSVMFDLSQHPKTIVHMEIFGAPRLPGGLPQTDRNRIELLHKLWAGYRNPEWMPRKLRGCARGFKLQFKRAGIQFNRPRRLARELRLYDPVVIALRRSDILKQAVSKVRSHMLAEINAAEWGVRDQHIKPESGPEARAFAGQPTKVPLDQLEAALDAASLDRADMEEFLQLCPPTVEITYEDYLTNRLDVLNRILHALQLEPFTEAPPPTVAKVTADDLSRAVSNYDEVLAFAQARGLTL